MKLINLETLFLFCVFRNNGSDQAERHENHKPASIGYPPLFLFRKSEGTTRQTEKRLITFLASHTVVDDSVCHGNCESGVGVSVCLQDVA